jgi:endonuclease YncB( thermonuclease family)
MALAAALAAAGVARGDWLVFFGGSVVETSGSWEVRGREVRFTTPAGTLQSVRAAEVDLATSAFLSWQIGDRRAIGAGRPPVGSELAPARDAAPAGEAPPCAPARVVAAHSAETVEIERGGRREIVHLACLDAPEAAHRLPELAHFGASADLFVAELAPPGAEVCVGDESPPLADREGHRIVYLRLADGRDLGQTLVAGGLALARGGACTKREAYLAGETAALAAEAGLWSQTAHDLSLAVVGLPSATGGRALLPPRRAGRRS